MIFSLLKNIYIQGCPRKGDAVIGTLQKLSGYNINCLSGDSEMYYYYVDFNRGNLIAKANKNSSKGRRIKATFYELKLPTGAYLENS